MPYHEDHPKIDSFANHVLTDWDTAIEQFFNRVEAKRVARGLSVKEVFAALDRGYGDVVADSWTLWAEVSHD